MKIGNFIFENNNDINILCIPSIIISLFMKEDIINDNFKEIDLIYCFKFMNDKIIHNIRNNKSVLLKDTNMFNLILEKINDKKKIIDKNKNININNIFHFIYTIFNIEKVNVFKQNLITKQNIENKYISYINLYINNKSKVIHINDLIESWICLNNDLYINFINNIPTILPLYINRYDKKGNYNNCEIIIKQNINPFEFYKKKNIDNYIWNFYSTICYCVNIKQYYCIINNDNRWYLFNHNNTPCFSNISMSDSMIVNKIKKESVFIFYKLVE
jgi:hypothetical protein